MNPSDDLTADHIRGVRILLEIARREVATLEARLAELLALAGRRPGDGSDQLRLFEPSAQPKLFEGE